MVSILRAVSGVVSQCGSNVPLRAAAAVGQGAVTVWLAAQLCGWAMESPTWCFAAFVAGLVYAVGSLVTIGAMSDPPSRWTMETMTGYAPFMMWRVTISDGRVTAWKVLLWPLLVPAEALVCLWLAVGWLGRLLNVDLSKR